MSMMPRSDEMLDLVGAIYDVALADDHWDRLLEQATETFGGTAAVFFVKDRCAPSLQFSRLWGLPSSAMDEFEQHFAPLDVGLDTLLARPPGSVITEEDTPGAIYRRSEIFNEFRRRWGVERYLCGDLFRDARRFGVLAIQASASRSAFDESERKHLAYLLPHLQRAVQLRSQLDPGRTHGDAFEDLIERLIVGLILLDASGRVIHANAAARRFERLQDGFRIIEGRLRADDASADVMLARAIGQAIDTTNGIDPGGGASFALSRASGAPSWRLLVSPGPGAVSESPMRIASALVMIGDPEAGLISSQRAERLYELTPAEAQLACAVASGKSLDDYAVMRGIATSTARWTMKRILAKTGARTQADLVRMLLTGPLVVADR